MVVMVSEVPLCRDVRASGSNLGGWSYGKGICRKCDAYYQVLRIAWFQVAWSAGLGAGECYIRHL